MNHTYINQTGVETKTDHVHGAAFNKEVCTSTYNSRQNIAQSQKLQNVYSLYFAALADPNMLKIILSGIIVFYPTNWVLKLVGCLVGIRVSNIHRHKVNNSVELQQLLADGEKWNIF